MSSHAIEIEPTQVAPAPGREGIYYCILGPLRGSHAYCLKENDGCHITIAGSAFVLEIVPCPFDELVVSREEILLAKMREFEDRCHKDVWSVEIVSVKSQDFLGKPLIGTYGYLRYIPPLAVPMTPALRQIHDAGGKAWDGAADPEAELKDLTGE